MNETKTFITNASKKKAFFLGTYIQWRQSKEKKVVITTRGKPTRITARMALLAPIDK